MAENFEISVTCPMDFSNYPFDDQRCPILFGDAEYEMESLVTTINTSDGFILMILILAYGELYPLLQ